MDNQLAPSIVAVLILDHEGNRICAKYYGKSNGSRFATTEQQQEFETKLFNKTKLTSARTDAEIIMLEGSISVYRTGSDTRFYVIGSNDENELILTAVLDGCYEALSSLLRGQLDRRTLLDNLELVLLTVDELVDGGIILETDAASIVSRVLMRGVEGTPETSLQEMTISDALKMARGQLAKSFR